MRSWAGTGFYTWRPLVSSLQVITNLVGKGIWYHMKVELMWTTGFSQWLWWKGGSPSGSHSASSATVDVCARSRGHLQEKQEEKKGKRLMDVMQGVNIVQQNQKLSYQSIQGILSGMLNQKFLNLSSRGTPHVQRLHITRNSDAVYQNSNISETVCPLNCQVQVKWRSRKRMCAATSEWRLHLPALQQLRYCIGPSHQLSCQVILKQLTFIWW